MKILTCIFFTIVFSASTYASAKDSYSEFICDLWKDKVGQLPDDCGQQPSSENCENKIQIKEKNIPNQIKGSHVELFASVELGQVEGDLPIISMSLAKRNGNHRAATNLGQTEVRGESLTVTLPGELGVARCRIR